MNDGQPAVFDRRKLIPPEPSRLRRVLWLAAVILAGAGIAVWQTHRPPRVTFVPRDVSLLIEACAATGGGIELRYEGDGASGVTCRAR